MGLSLFSLIDILQLPPEWTDQFDSGIQVSFWLILMVFYLF